jgi:elongator complex protein 1
LNVFEEFKSYMAKHALYEEALLLYRYQEEYIRGIMERYASYLQDNSKFKDAGIGRQPNNPLFFCRT